MLGSAFAPSPFSFSPILLYSFLHLSLAGTICRKAVGPEAGVCSTISLLSFIVNSTALSIVIHDCLLLSFARTRPVLATAETR